MSNHVRGKENIDSLGSRTYPYASVSFVFTNIQKNNLKIGKLILKL